MHFIVYVSMRVCEKTGTTRRVCTRGIVLASSRVSSQEWEDQRRKQKRRPPVCLVHVCTSTHIRYAPLQTRVEGVQKRFTFAVFVLDDHRAAVQRWVLREERLHQSASVRFDDVLPAAGHRFMVRPTNPKE